ncbi:hypothetical protein SHKM778_77200 [Streptomyces sp. KM77-8]|uniref:Uncharacterized protein n=1 Tax=Streptomyces haneummycinicus TaxID=3074435 RepID=A0AAT9HWF5_9ACTN
MFRGEPAQCLVAGLHPGGLGGCALGPQRRVRIGYGGADEADGALEGLLVVAAVDAAPDDAVVLVDESGGGDHVLPGPAVEHQPAERDVAHPGVGGGGEGHVDGVAAAGAEVDDDQVELAVQPQQQVDAAFEGVLAHGELAAARVAGEQHQPAGLVGAGAQLGCSVCRQMSILAGSVTPPSR